MEDKTVFAVGRPVGEVIASGEAEFGMQQIIENQPVQGLIWSVRCRRNCEISFPYSAGFPRCGRSGSRARPGGVFAFPEAARIIRDKGMEPRRFKSGKREIRRGAMAQMCLWHRAFSAHIRLTWSGTADTYRELYGRR